MALAYVLWIVALLGLLVGGLENAARTQVLLSRNQLAEAQAGALAEGALSLVLAELAASAPEAVRTGPRRVRLPTGQAVVTVTDLGGLIDLNEAPPALLARGLRAAGVAPEQATAAAKQIVALREARQAALPKTQSAAAIEAGFDVAARPLLLAEELAPRLALTQDQAARFAAMVTVHGGHQTVDPGVASPAVVLALTDLDQAAAERYLAARAEGGRFVAFAAPDAGPVIGAGFALRAEAASAGGRAVRLAVVKPARLGSPDQGLRLVDWEALRGG
jgi:hypothetical protein